MFAPVYLDHNATTPVAPAVVEAMLPFFSRQYGNASSRHEYGRAAKRALDEARQKVAAAVGAHPTEVVFTSGGTEANNLFVKGAAQAMKPGLIALSAMEHSSVRIPAKQLERSGWQRHEIGVAVDGRICGERYRAALAEKPTLVSVMLANNETGVIQDVPSLAESARPLRAWFHTDAVQALGKMALDFRALNARGVNAMTLSAHKIHGPKGAGALIVDKRVELSALISGGGQERNLRAGTENVAALVGFGAACELALQNMATRTEKLRRVSGLGARVFGSESERVPNTVYFAFPGIDGETLVGKLDRAGYALGTGSACSDAANAPSATLLAMGFPESLAKGAVRLSLGEENDTAQVDGFLNALAVLREQFAHGLATVNTAAV
jgi:cysteine desulfurase